MRSYLYLSVLLTLETIVGGSHAVAGEFQYPLYGKAANLFTNNTPYDLAQESYVISEVWRMGPDEYYGDLNLNKGPVTRGDNTYLLITDTGRRPQVVKINSDGAEKGYIDPILYQPDDFFKNHDMDPSNNVATADFYRVHDDGHHTGALGVDELGYIHIVIDMHNYPIYLANQNDLPNRYAYNTCMYWRSDNPHDVSSFSFLGGDEDKMPQGIGFTYPYFFNDWNGKLHFASRLQQFDAKRCAGFSRYDASTGRWSVVGGTVPNEPEHPRLFWEDNGEDGGSYSKTFPTGLFDRNNKMHLTAPILNNDESPQGAIIHFATDILYLQSSDGGDTFTKAEGSAVAVPARAEAGPNQADVVYTNQYLDITGRIAVDYENNPYTIAGIKYADGSDKDSIVLGWDGTQWVNYGEPIDSGTDFRIINGPDGVINYIPDSGGGIAKLYRFWKPDGSIQEVDLPDWLNNFIDDEYLKQTGNIQGMTYDNGDYVMYRVEITRPGLGLVTPPQIPLTNNAPEITVAAATSPSSITTLDTTTCSVSAQDPDGDTLTYTWYKASGNGSVSFGNNGTSTSSNITASFSQPGTYELKVRVSDGIETRISSCFVSVTSAGEEPEEWLTNASFEWNKVNFWFSGNSGSIPLTPEMVGNWVTREWNTSPNMKIRDNSPMLSGQHENRTMEFRSSNRRGLVQIIDMSQTDLAGRELVFSCAFAAPGREALSSSDVATYQVIGFDSFTGLTADLAGSYAFTGGSYASLVPKRTIADSELSGDAFITFGATLTAASNYNYLAVLVGGLGGVDASASQYVAVDPVTLTLTPTNTYSYWADSHSLVGGGGDYGADPDADGINNLVEYALDGDPNLDDAAEKLPTFGISEADGTNWLNYIYNRRRDAAARNLTYDVLATDDLVSNVWTNTTEEAGSVALDAKFESVTNHVSTEVEMQQFMRLEIGINE